MSAETIAAALELRSHGFPLVPLDGKRPHVGALLAVHETASWSHLRERPATEREIAGWFEHAPRANLGVIVPPGRTIVDVDRPEHFRGKTHPPTPCVQTARGRHLYFEGEAGPGVHKAPFGDIIGAGSYVAAPPSLHVCGRRYAWEIGLQDAALAQLPGWAAPDIATTPLSRQDVLPKRHRKAGESLSADPYAVAAVLALLGRRDVIDVRTGRTREFRCVLPDHADRRKSAGVFVSDETGEFRYCCHGCGASVSLPLLFAWACVGRRVELAAPTLARWATRMWHEAGVSRVQVPPAALPIGCTPLACRLADGFLWLAATRAARGDHDPIPYTARFAASWCGDVPIEDAKEALRELRDAGWLVVVEESRPGVGYLYAPPAIGGRA